MAVPLARSDTDDPTGSWKGVDLVLEADQKPGSWGDFDQIGFATEAIGLSINVFQNGDDGRPRPNGYAIYVIKRADLDRTPPVLTVDRHYALKDARFAVAPVNDHEGRLKGPAFWANSSKRSEAADILVRLDLVRKEGAWAFERRATEIGDGPVQTLAKHQLAPMQVSEPDGAVAFTQGGQPSTVQLVQGEFWFVQTVAHPDDRARTAVRWVRIRESDNHILGESVIADPVLSLLQPSIAADKGGRVVISCGGTSTQQKLSAYAIAGRAAGERVTFGTPTMIKEGTGVHAASGRWGDYTTTVADPAGDGRFWTFIPYAQSDGTWATQITEVIVGG
jgi:hypothetical protein